MKISRFIWTLALIGVLLVAALKNPSESEAKVMVENKINTILNQKVEEKLLEDNDKADDNNIISGLVTGFIQGLVPKVLHEMSTVDVNNYVVFSTFDVTLKKLNQKAEKKSLAHGVIVFGKVVPLGTDLNENDLDF